MPVRALCAALEIDRLAMWGISGSRWIGSALGGNEIRIGDVAVNVRGLD